PSLSYVNASSTLPFSPFPTYTRIYTQSHTVTHRERWGWGSRSESTPSPTFAIPPNRRPNSEPVAIHRTISVHHSSPPLKTLTLPESTNITFLPRTSLPFATYNHFPQFQPFIHLLHHSLNQVNISGSIAGDISGERDLK
ncbi:hypothetical protein M8C21_022125, partial [Ambrosia artemisiifolia]